MSHFFLVWKVKNIARQVKTSSPDLIPPPVYYDLLGTFFLVLFLRLSETLFAGSLAGWRALVLRLSRGEGVFVVSMTLPDLIDLVATGVVSISSFSSSSSVEGTSDNVDWDEKADASVFRFVLEFGMGMGTAGCASTSIWLAGVAGADGPIPAIPEAMTMSLSALPPSAPNKGCIRFAGSSLFERVELI
jgi:hypothetical protein